MITAAFLVGWLLVIPEYQVYVGNGQSRFMPAAIHGPFKQKEDCELVLAHMKPTKASCVEIKK